MLANVEHPWTREGGWRGGVLILLLVLWFVTMVSDDQSHNEQEEMEELPDMSPPRRRIRQGPRHNHPDISPVCRRSQRLDQRPVEIVDLVENSESDSTCIDLTDPSEVGDSDEFVDLTGVNDTSVIVLNHAATAVRVQNINIDDDLEDSVIMLPSTGETSFDIGDTAGGSCDSPSVTSPDRNKISCPICMDSYKQIMRSKRQLASTTCGHVFCRKCIATAVNTQHCCPTCRKKLSQKQIHPLFL